MNLRRFITLVAICSLFKIGISQAAIIDNGDYTSDTTAGLDWLDLTLTIGRSHDDISSQFGTDGDFEGYRYATAAELIAFVENATGIDNPMTGVGQSFTSGAGHEILISLLGSTADAYHQQLYGMSYSEYTGLDENYTIGILGDLYNDISDLYTTDNYHYASIGDNTAGGNDALYTANIVGGHIVFPNAGSFLVRTSSVPEPASYALMGLGLLGLSLARRRKTVA